MKANQARGMSRLSDKLLFLAPSNFTFNVWGGNWIPRWKNLKNKSDRPVGESWELSAHPSHPSMILSAESRSIPLPYLIKRQPAKFLGARVVRKTRGRFPFLIKFIDARENLSLQVHPSSAYARRVEREEGKFESWVILGEPHKPAGSLYLGFSTKMRLSPSRLRESFFEALKNAQRLGLDLSREKARRAERMVLPFVNKFKVVPGEAFALPPGTVHAIGQGVRLFEIQQSSDVTYRIWDWNRLDGNAKKGQIFGRPLHWEKAFDALTFESRSPERYRFRPRLKNPTGAGRIKEEILVWNESAHLAANRLTLRGTDSFISMDSKSGFYALTGIKGRSALFQKTEGKWSFEGLLPEGHTVLVPAGVQECRVQSDTDENVVMKSYVP